MTSYKLTYFDIDGGRAEPIRIAFHAAGIDFEDNRISFAEFQEMRKDTRFNCVPVLEIDGAAADYVAVPVEGEEFERVAAEYPLPLPIRFLMGFPPPREILRLDPTT